MMTIIAFMQDPGPGAGLPGWVAPVSVLGIVGALLGAGMWIGAVNSDRKSFGEFMNEVRDDIKKILGRLGSAVADGNSPLRLNELGKAISEEINARAWADKHVPIVASRLEGSEAFEIQDFCFAYVTQVEYTDSEERTIRRSAYENAIDAYEVRRVLAFELRDKLLAKAGLEAP
ncbi:MAG: hypothetical protein F4164_05305 [Gemmatimonadales bacterium]|nr:hypothetical protein [Gemmatimonadales bacterium]MYG48787.1 hypothetical protein [Gemmatimonadales bacterium]MYK01201.1 hypothetical protein [Candidatus Palauibacter ramosifaciens]